MRETNTNFIFNPSSNKQEKEKEQDTYYTVSGKEDFIDKSNNPCLNRDDDRTFAKRILRQDGTYKFMVKINASGKLDNPISIYGEEKVNNFLDKTCKDFRFKTVNHKIFDYYLNFLRTKNLSWLYNAEREAE